MRNMPNLDLLVPKSAAPRDGWRWGTIISVSPVTVHLDNDPAGIYLPANSPGGTPVAGARVWCQLHGSGAGSRVVIVSQPIADYLPGSSSFTQYDDATLPSAWPNGLTIGNTGSDAGWPLTFASLTVTKASNDARVVQEVTRSGTGATPSETWRRSSASSSAWGPWQLIHANTGWLTSGLTYGNGVSSYASLPIGYMRDGNWVVMRGLADRAAGWTAGTAFTAGITMPVGYRIQRDDFFIATSASPSGAFPARLRINTNGTIDFRIQSAQTNNADFYSMNNVRYWSPL